MKSVLQTSKQVNFSPYINSLIINMLYPFRLKALFVFAYALIFFQPNAQAQWTFIGSQSFTPAEAFMVDFTFKGTTPYVVYRDGENGYRPTVMEYNNLNSTWETIGAVGFTPISTNEGQNISIVVDDSNEPYIAFIGTDSKAAVWQHIGMTWQPVGTNPVSAGSVTNPKLAMHDNVPFIAFSDGLDGDKATVLTFNGADWVAVGNTGFSSGAVSAIKLAFSGNTPYVAFIDKANGDKITVMRLNGTTWELVGAAAFSSVVWATYLSFAMNGSTPYVAYNDLSNYGEPSVMRYNGTTWETLGGGQISTYYNSRISLALDGNTPYIAYSDAYGGNRTTVQKFNGTSWSVVGTSGFTTGVPDDNILAFNNNNLYLAYNNQDDNYKLSLMRYEPVLPVELRSFTGKYTEGGNLLTWTTANETNNKGFSIERSPQPPKGASEKWETLGFVAAKGKAAKYDFLDAAPPLGAGGSYYRLRQIDNDGTETLSKVVSIINKGTGKLNVHPSVTNHYLSIDTEATDDFQIINLLGQVILRGQSTPQIDVSALHAGTYFLKIGDATSKFVKQ